MINCAYCGENVGDDGVFVDDEIFCSEECMRDYGARDSYGGDDDDDDDFEEDDDDFDDDDDVDDDETDDDD
jgi:hypothetical protein